MKLYSNEDNKRLIASMISKGREPHSVIITGEKGSGRKALGRYLAAALLCEEGTGTPCGKCKSCRMAEHDAHPDLITAQSNANGNYLVADIRQIVSDAVITPNEGKLKVVMIPDLDRSVNTLVAVQNILLKLVEEPPEHCVIIMTAVSKETFLPTIISRVVCFAAQPCTPAQAEEWLTVSGKYGQDDIIRAAACCGGNFGRCVEYLEGSELPAAFECARKVCEAVTADSEYDMLCAFTEVQDKKPLLRQTLVFAAEIFRASAVISAGAEPGHCCAPDMAAKLARRLGSSVSERYYSAVTEAILRIDCNVSRTLAVNDLCCTLSGNAV
ncbi:MAG: hypothetical protein IKP47_05425 [Ruminococcus sp.]|nr:hypothetical protein [Ruminococcus sp.]